DGAIVDEIVISPDAYLNSPPGTRRDDTTILVSTVPATASANQPPSVALTSPSTGSAFSAPAAIAMAAAASDPENRLARVDFYAGTTLLGSDTTAPYTFSWQSVPAGTYSL